MGSLTRDDIISELLRKVADSFHPVDVYGFSLPLYDSTLDLPRETLQSYSTDLLITLHMEATASNREERTGNFLHARKGRSESYVRTYMALSDSSDDLFPNYAANFNSTSATHSLPLYSTLTYENTPSYYQKAIALSGTVSMIQNGIYSESHYDHINPRLISYSKDPDDSHGIDKLARIASDDLVDLILSRPEDWRRIAAIVVERETDDVEVIRSIIDSDAIMPIARGML